MILLCVCVCVCVCMCVCYLFFCSVVLPFKGATFGQLFMLNMIKRSTLVVMISFVTHGG